MKRRDGSFVPWAAQRIAKASREDADAPIFGAPLAKARALSPAERRLVSAFPDRGADPAGLQKALARLLDRSLANGRTPRFENQLFSGVADPAMAGALLGLFSNNTVSTGEIAPLATEMERAVLSWLLRLVPWDGARAGGSATPGGSFSNLLAMYLARKAAEARHGADAIPRLAYFVSRAGHYSIPKGADLVGLPRGAMIEVPTDAEERMRPDLLADAVRDARRQGRIPFLVIATSGTTVAGALDPVRDIARVAESERLWLHVDAAWGCFGLLGPDAARFRAGLERADSVTFDEHKHGGAPVAWSWLLVRNGAALEELRPPTGGGYLFHRKDAVREEADLGLTSLACGKPFMALASWLAWKSMGATGWKRRVAHAAKLTRRFRDGIAASDRWELALEPQTWLVVFRPKVPAVTSRVARDAVSRDLRRRINASGRWMINLCPMPDGYAFRAIFTNPLMTESHVDELLAHLARSAGASS
ncbi:MAG: L-2,4-diaminobutyrate decarboxylase [Planctomycetes bacterium]|nr:L-2,4-diaminobutyrate decarboxylase [Planctomycetota bacterium]